MQKIISWLQKIGLSIYLFSLIALSNQQNILHDSILNIVKIILIIALRLL
jgi:hypothetical protein